MSGTQNIPFNKPYLSGNELHYIKEAIISGKISGNGKFTKKCHQYIESRYDFNKCLMTTSCTDALEMAAILVDIQPGDEVIMPSYTFVSTANAFILRGAIIRFVDSKSEEPNMDVNHIESLITPRTKVIVVVHYAGVACDMGRVLSIADKYNLVVVEDAAQAIDSYYIHLDGKKSPLGCLGNFGAFSFHETKNIIAGEGGMLLVNDIKDNDRAEVIWEKGTNRAAFFRGHVDKYRWIDIGSSFLPSEMNAAYLYAQFENLDRIQNKRLDIWNQYFHRLSTETSLKLPIIPDYATNNAHMFYVICESEVERDQLINFMKSKGIMAVFHYLSLHRSTFYEGRHDGRMLLQSDRYSDTLLRLPLYYELTESQLNYICDSIVEFYSR